MAPQALSAAPRDQVAAVGHAACALLGLAGLAASAPARADMITTWNAKAIELLPKMKKQGPYNLRGLAMSLGGKDSAKRTDEQTIIAKFDAPPEFPVWNAIARSVVGNRKLSLDASARLFAQINLAMHSSCDCDCRAVVHCADTDRGNLLSDQ